MLWTAIRDVQKEFPHVVCVVYTGDTDASKEQILFKVKVRHITSMVEITLVILILIFARQSRFNIELKPQSLAFVYLRKRYLVEDSRYRRLTLLLQSLASMRLGYEAISSLVPDVYFGMMEIEKVAAFWVHISSWYF